jgi:DNA-binding GntR family transcriptional regulator
VPRLTLALPKRKIARTGLTDGAYDALEEMILDQKLAPGTYLNIDQLARSLEVSTSPLREALARLHAKRLVRMEPYVGYFVEEMPDKGYYHELIDLRLMLECFAARSGAPMQSSGSTEIMEQAVRAMRKLKVGGTYKDYRVFNAWDARFHRALVESCRNRPLLQAYLDLNIHLHEARLYVIVGGVNTKAAVHDHELILAKFKTGNGEAAEDAVRSHLNNARKRLLGHTDFTPSTRP